MLPKNFFQNNILNKTENNYSWKEKEQNGKGNCKTAFSGFSSLRWNSETWYIAFNFFIGNLLWKFHNLRTQIKNCFLHWFIFFCNTWIIGNFRNIFLQILHYVNSDNLKSSSTYPPWYPQLRTVSNGKLSFAGLFRWISLFISGINAYS